MKHLRFYVALCVVAVGCSACTVKGAIRENFYQPVAQQDRQKIPLKVGVVVNDETKTAEVDKWGRVKIAIYPGISNAITAGLATIFKEVKVVERTGRSQDEDLLAFLSVSCENVSDLRAAHITYIIRTQIYFRDPRSQKLISKVERSSNIQIDSADGSAALGLATIFSAFLLAPITVPISNSINADYMVQVLEEKLPGVVRAVVDDIWDDTKLRSPQVGVGN